MTIPDPVALSQALIRCPSVTPEDAGAIAVLETALKRLGFACHRLRFEENGTAAIENLYARIGTQGPNFCFAGHTDVVPPGDTKLWRHGPFAAVVENGTLYGRGAADMKSAIASFVAAAARYLATGKPYGSISLLITGDEEGIATNGTKKMLAWLQERGERLDHCVVGEPTSTVRAGDTIKIGRRGSMNARLTVRGTQGHVAYPHQAANPLPVMAALVSRLSSQILDTGNEHFDPSTLSFTTIDTGNAATNVIPAEARAGFNIRFTDQHTPESLQSRIAEIVVAMRKEFACEIDVAYQISGVSFLTKPGPFTELLAAAAQKVTGKRPEYSTTGGTSDARFIKDHCPVAELGLSNATMHKTNECATLEDIGLLTDIYSEVIAAYFANPPR
ncbi:MAG TPA: succinyl-diaminopimelate desuccinylase [Rhizomicrobium sp.]|nr:succinyl-diaminopimelate desuccinylase [Rhizomicrobium sp.]